MYGIAIDKDRLHSRGGGLRGGVKTTGTIASSVTVPFPLFQRRQSSECLPATQYDDFKRSHPLSYAENKTTFAFPLRPHDGGFPLEEYSDFQSAADAVTDPAGTVQHGRRCHCRQILQFQRHGICRLHFHPRDALHRIPYRYGCRGQCPRRTAVGRQAAGGHRKSRTYRSVALRADRRYHIRAVHLQRGMDAPADPDTR